MSYAVEIEGLAHRFGKKEVLVGVDLVVPEGSVTGVIGTNGTGKSTLLRLLAAELRLRTGRVSVLGLDPRKRPRDVKRAIGWVPERTDLPPWMTVGEHFRFLEAFYPAWDRELEQKLVELFDLDSNAKYDALSKGQRAAENLVAALAYRPRLLLLDEPFSGLDPLARRRVLDGVFEHLREEGTSALLVSHSLADVERAVDRVARLARGRIAFCDDVDGLWSRAVRIGVTLREDVMEWTPPGDPLVENGWPDPRLFYLDWDQATEDALRTDPAVVCYEPLPRDLEDVLVATETRESAA